MNVIDIKDASLYADWSVEELDEHVKALRKVRDDKAGSTSYPNKKRLSQMLDPASDDFMGTGMNLADFMAAGFVGRVEASFFNQSRQEKKRRLKYILELSALLCEIREISISATGLAEIAIEDIIEGQWSGLRDQAQWLRDPDEELREKGFIFQTNEELQALWKAFAHLLKECFDTRPGAPAAPAPKN